MGHQGHPETLPAGGADWDRMGPYVEKAMSRIPISMDVGVRKFFCGPESFTPDLAPIVGEAPELKNYFVAAGLNSIGILTGGGLGRVLAHWIVNGRPDVDVTGFNIDRLQTYQANPEYRRTRTVESLGMVYQCHYPTRSMQTARGAKRSALHDRLAAKGAYFKDVSGWEGPDWYAPPGVEPKVDALSWGRQNWFPYWEAEHKATREGVILMDMSFMSKFWVEGRDAGKVLNQISANDIDGAAGHDHLRVMAERGWHPRGRSHRRKLSEVLGVAWIRRFAMWRPGWRHIPSDARSSQRHLRVRESISRPARRLMQP
jgi:4-methylaminobutanoate oxidase (formaldehyde-forming)